MLSQFEALLPLFGNKWILEKVFIKEYFWFTDSEIPKLVANLQASSTRLGVAAQ